MQPGRYGLCAPLRALAGETAPFLCTALPCAHGCIVNALTSTSVLCVCVCVLFWPPRAARWSQAASHSCSRTTVRHMRACVHAPPADAKHPLTPWHALRRHSARTGGSLPTAADIRSAATCPQQRATGCSLPGTSRTRLYAPCLPVRAWLEPGTCVFVAHQEHCHSRVLVMSTLAGRWWRWCWKRVPGMH